MASQFSIQAVNSVSYVDVVALQLGLQRITGEKGDAFLDRLYAAASNVRDHTLQGTIDQIAFEFGLNVSPGILITPIDPTTVIQVVFGQISIKSGVTAVTIPLVKIAIDNYWEWRMLSDVVADINAKTTATASLLGPDAPGWQLNGQSSINVALAEPVVYQQSLLEHRGVLVGTERFSTAVPSYTLTSAGALVFASTPPVGTTVAYVYNISPMTLAVSQVGAFSFLDPAVTLYAAGPDGSMVQQLREYTQDLLTQDPCYWGV